MPLVRKVFVFRAVDNLFKPFADRPTIFLALDFCFFIGMFLFLGIYRNPVHEYNISRQWLVPAARTATVRFLICSAGILPAAFDLGFAAQCRRDGGATKPPMR
jgi:hypothetical protein